MQHEDARDQSVRAMMARYQVDEAQAQRVAMTADQLLRQCEQQWRLQAPPFSNMLGWSACLHEIGLDIAHDGFQRHGAYIAENADMPGFPRAEKRFLAYLIENQRHRFDTRLLDFLPGNWRHSAIRLSMLLRLAVLLNRSRSPVDMPSVILAVNETSMNLEFDADWLSSNPLTIADLEREQGYLRDTDYELNFS